MGLIYILSVLFIVVELFLSGTIAGFMRKKFQMKDLLRFLIPVIIIDLLLFIGLFTGNGIAGLFEELKIWYAGTILFVLSLKLMYDGIKLNSLKKAINTSDNKGLIHISISSNIIIFVISSETSFNVI